MFTRTNFYFNGFAFISMQTPAATVAPASLIANLAMCGFVACVSSTRFPIGLILTFATSPFFKKSGFFAVCPSGLVFSINSMNWHGTCAV